MAATLDRWRGETTYREISRRAGVSLPTVLRACQGTGIPEEGTIAKICEAMGHTRADLMRDMAEQAEVSP